MPKRKLTEEEKTKRKEKMKWKESVNSYKREIERSYNECIRVINQGLVREPTYFFNVGDRVTWGAWEWIHVLEVLENGKMYKILRITPDVQYGKYKEEKAEISYILWAKIRPYRTIEEDKKIKIFLEKDDIQLSFYQSGLDSLISRFYSSHSTINMNPPYQRDLVWEEIQKIQLIDSIFKNIDIGKFTFIELPYSKNHNFHLEVLDGKQRINAIMDFYECRFKYKGHYYNDLSYTDRNHFKSYSISLATTRNLTEEQRYRYFLKLNTSGTPIEQEHLDNVKKMWLNEIKKEMIKKK